MLCLIVGRSLKRRWRRRPAEPPAPRAAALRAGQGHRLHKSGLAAIRAIADPGTAALPRDANWAKRGILADRAPPVDPDKPWLGTTERAKAHPCQGYADRFDRITVANSAVLASVLKVAILADTLVVEPTTAGRIVVEGKTLTIVEVRSDPAGATCELQART